MLVTGGASFIGSHLVHALLQRDAQVRVVDDLSSGRRENLSARIDPEGLEFRVADLLDPGVAEQAVEDVDVVFHLAAVHGGRGFVDTHQAETSLNFALDSLVIHAARAAGVQQFVFASSGCVYPVGMQMDVGQELFLAEDAVGPPYHADNIYGWAKLMTELTLRAFAREHGFRSVSCRLFTVFGEHGHENHAIHAMIARALVGQDPFEVWGDGRQVRNWTHVSDTVAGLLAAAEHIDDGSAVNLGTTERTRVVDAVRLILGQVGHAPEIRFRPEMPTGPLNRAADITRARELCGWSPRVSFTEGIRRTIAWYRATQDLDALRAGLPERLLERGRPQARDEVGS